VLPFRCFAPGLRRYTGLTTGNLNFSSSQFIHLRLLRKNPFEPQVGRGAGGSETMRLYALQGVMGVVSSDEGRRV